MTRDSANLSIDFLVGFTIFLLAFIWVVSMIPGLLINLQGYTIDYDAVAYRTGVILVEDPGVPTFPVVPSWENALPTNVVRFGLAKSKDTPYILSEEKVNRFFCSTVFPNPEDYQKRVIFGDYPYRFNISLLDVERNNTLYVGDSISGSYGSIRRLVKIKGTSNATINYTYMGTHHFINGDNETRHEFSILVNNKELVNGKVTNPIYQIDPAREKLMINITDLNKTMFADRESCFNISLNKIYIYVVDEKIIPLHLYYNPIINGIQYTDITSDALYDTELPKNIHNISLVFDPTMITWSDYSQVYINLTFDLVKTNLGCACPTCPGSQFLNNTPGIPFDYNYHPDNVTQPNLRDAVLEVSVGSGSRTATEMLIKPLNADFEFIPTLGTTVKFLDKSTGSPVDWTWNFGDGNTSTQSNPIHTFPGPGTYTVSLTVKNAAGDSNGPKSKNVVLLVPVADFSGAPVSGPAPLPVIFTDTSTQNPTSWKWEFNKTAGGSWTQFSTARTPTYNFPGGSYDIRLTATNTIGSDNETKLAYITAIPLPIADFTANPILGVKPLTVTFSDTTTNNPNLWNWSFGDGNYSASQNPAYIYASTGLYTVSLTATNSSVGSSTMTKPGYINVTAVPATYTITASAVGGGTIDPSGSILVNQGASKKFNITPNTGYHTVNILVDGVAQVPIPNNYTFTNVNGPHTIAASFDVNMPVTIFFDGFESARPSGNLWTETGTVNWGTGYPHIGTRSVQLRGSAGAINRTISTAGNTSIDVSYNLGASSLESGEYVNASWYNGITWAELSRISSGDTNADGNLHLYSSSLPADAANNPKFALRFLVQGNNNQDYCYVDDVKVIGTQI